MPRPIPEFNELIRPLQATPQPAPAPKSVKTEKVERTQWKRELVSTSKLNKTVRVGFYLVIALAFLYDMDTLFWITAVLGVIHALTDKQLSIWHLQRSEESQPVEPRVLGSQSEDAMLAIQSAPLARAAVRGEAPPAA